MKRVRGRTRARQYFFVVLLVGLGGGLTDGQTAAQVCNMAVDSVRASSIEKRHRFILDGIVQVIIFISHQRWRR